MFRRGRRCLAIALAVAALALPAAPAAAAGQSEGGAGRTVGMELWARLGEIGGWLRGAFLSDYTGFIDPNGLQGTNPNGTNDYTSFIDPDG